jgi:glycine dehydrogenase
MRYIKKLERKDLSLTFNDCFRFLYDEIKCSGRNVTFKYALLNTIHPFAPLDQVAGYTKCLKS